MKEHLKHSRKSNSSYQNKILTLQSEIQKLTDYKVKLEHVVKRKHLLERESLTLQLQEATDNLRSKDTKIKVGPFSKVSQMYLSSFSIILSLPTSYNIGTRKRKGGNDQDP